MIALAFILFINIQNCHGQSTISGRVLSQVTGLPVSGADLDAFDENGSSVVIVGGTTGANGTYSITLPGPGVYRLRVDMKVGEALADQYYGGGISMDDSTPINVPTITSVITGIDFSLLPGYTLSGKILDSGLPVELIDLDVFSMTGEFLGSYPGVSDASGSYEIGPLPSGAYYVDADPDPALNPRFVRTYFGDTPDIGSATVILIADAPVSNKDINLLVGGFISGKILDSSNAPLSGIDLDVFDSLGNRLSANAASSTNGVYTIGPLASGSYYLRADPSITSGIARALYPASLGFDTASLIPVSSSQTTLAIDFLLEAAGTISGTIEDATTLVPLADVDLDVFDVVGNRLDFSALTGPDGSYTIARLPAGNYVIKSDPSSSTDYPDRYFDGVLDKASATPVTVTASADTPAIDFKLTKGGWISGTIRDSNGIALTGIDLDIFDGLGVRLEASARSGIDGSYRLGPLASGSYVVRADPKSTSGYLLQYYPDSPDATTASLVVVNVSATTAMVDFSLPDAGWIEGFVTDQFGSPLQGIDLDLFDAVTLLHEDQSATSDLDGHYLIGPLAVQSYLVRADPSASQMRVREYFNEQAVRTDANPVAVSAGVGTTNINFTLSQGSSIRGFARSRADGSPIVGADIDVFRSDLSRMDQSATTQMDGAFIVGPLPPGNYLVKVDAQLSTLYVDSFFGDTADPLRATPITLTPSVDVSDITISLPVLVIRPSFSVSTLSGMTTTTTSFPTELGRSYSFEKSDTLLPESWIKIMTVTGDGMDAVLTEEFSSDVPRRFYRIVVEP